MLHRDVKIVAIVACLASVAVVDVHRGDQVGMLGCETAVEEIFDVQLLPGLRFPEVIGFQKETVHHTFVVPRAMEA